MLGHVGLLVLGLALLYYGAKWLIHGASGLAHSFGVSDLVIGLTVVAYGTSMPELVVSGLAALEGKSAIALGNVVGSNIANIGLILGITVLICPPKVSPQLRGFDLPVMIAAALAVPAILWDGLVSRIEGLVLTLAAVACTVYTLRRGEAQPEPEGPAGGDPPAAPEATSTLVAYTIVGLVTLVGGGKVFVDGASGLAAALGVSERVIALTVVAAGTSMPELAASLMAARRGFPGIAVGNVVGSNIFNVLLILGLSALACPIPGTIADQRLDLIAMLAFTALAAAMLWSERTMRRAEGLVLLLGYGAFLGLLVHG